MFTATAAACTAGGCSGSTDAETESAIGTTQPPGPSTGSTGGGPHKPARRGSATGLEPTGGAGGSADGAAIVLDDAGADANDDAGADANDDAGADAGDAAVDATEDAGTDAMEDAGTDAMEDAMPDAGVDAGWVDLYDEDTIPKFAITVDATGMAVLTSTVVADQKKWVHGTFSFGGITFADVGVRRKGESTFRALPKKAAFKIRFDKYVSGQRLFGLSEITLNNMVDDPTFLAERLAYHVFRAEGLPAPRANAAELSINGDNYGIYANIETPNADLLKRVFGTNAKTLYEVNDGSEWLPGQEDGFEVDVGDGTKSDVLALFSAVQAAQPATLLTDVAANLDTTEWLRFSATEGAVGHYDGYAFGIWGSHNYFMAGDQSGKFSLMPWSTDLTLSDRETVVDTSNPLSVDAQPLLIERCKTSTPCWTAYKDQMKSVLAVYESENLVALAQKWHGQIDALVKADPKRETTLSYYASETSLLYTWLAARPGVVRTQLGLTP